MYVKEVLEALDLGSSVAEHDSHLERHFIETQTFNDLISDRCDLIEGDKGTGKTALYKILEKKYTQYSQLKDTEVVAAFNLTGNPVFQNLLQCPVLTEAQYGSLWKTYILSIAGNYILNLYEDNFNDKMKQLDKILKKNSLRVQDETPGTVFTRLTNFLKKIKPDAVACPVSVNDSGIINLTPMVSFKGESDREDDEKIPHEYALRVLNEVAGTVGLNIWLALDRLDEAFVGNVEIEVPTLRALLRTYLDMNEFSNIKLKLFIRKDLFRKIIAGGFVNLTHINARKKEIVWDDDDLENLLKKRVFENTQFVASLGEFISKESYFSLLFPEQVDSGLRKSKTWNWMIARIRDGNGISPRNLIDLVQKAQEAQCRREEREPRKVETNISLIESDSIKKGLSRLSEMRVEDTLLAEAANLQEYIERFRYGKAEHNLDTIQMILDLDNFEETVQELVNIGFLEKTKSGTYKVPMLYRDGLKITQGKAF